MNKREQARIAVNRVIDYIRTDETVEQWADRITNNVFVVLEFLGMVFKDKDQSLSEAPEDFGCEGMLKFEVCDGKKKVGVFYIPDDASKEFIEKNIPPTIRAIQLIAGKIKETGY